MLDAGLRFTFRHFWTLFFVAAAVTVPLHLIYAFTFHNVIGLRELAPQIQNLPAHRHVHLVGPTDLQHARVALWIVDVVEVALIPLGIRAARAVLEADESGEVPTAIGAWKGALGRLAPPVWRFHRELVVAALAGIIVGALGDAIGRLFAEPFGTEWSFVVLGLMQGCARAAGACFFLGPAALLSRSSPDMSRKALP
jgi:hypothetical protein